MIQITRTGVIADVRQIAHLRQEFEQYHCVVLLQLVEPSLIQYMMQSLERVTFSTTHHYGREEHEFAKDLTIAGGEAALHLFHLLLNSPKLFEIIQQITSCLSIGGFAGRIYRNLPGSDHHLDWHDDDITADRLIGLSLNLSPTVYMGGVFQLRKKGSSQLLREVAHTCLGDAHIFRIAPYLEHRLTPVVGTQARTAGAGWFGPQSEYIWTIKNLLQ